MAAKFLTPIAVANAKPHKDRVEIPDRGCGGLYLVVQPSGAKSWALRYRFNAKPKKLTLGSALTVQADVEPKNPVIGVPLTLKGARKLAMAELHKIGQGIDPGVEKKTSRASAEQVASERAEDTIGKLVPKFIDWQTKVKKRKSAAQTDYLLKKNVLEAWSGRVIHDIKRRDIIELVEAIAGDRPYLANRVLAAVRRFFNWAGKRDIIAANPCTGVEPPGEEKARERVLSDVEIVSLWKATDGIGEPFGPLVKLMLLTGQRKSEVSGMKWSEIDVDVWTLPGERTKNARLHIVPLSAQASAIIKSVTPIAGSDFVFTTTGTTSVGGFSRAKERLDKGMKGVKPWKFHDLRRTCATGLQKLGVETPVIERALNHISGSFKGVTGVYQRHDFADEKRIALQRWADHIDALVSGKPAAKVIKLRARRR